MKNSESKDSKRLVPALRFPEFVNDGEWKYVRGNELFVPVVNKIHDGKLPILAITQEQGAIPRDLINYKVIVSNQSIENYKVVEEGDFIISLRSFQGGIEYSRYKGICRPAYIILRKKSNGVHNDFYRYYFKSARYINDLNLELEGIRDGKMVSYQQFSRISIPYPNFAEQQKIAEFLSALDEHLQSTKEELYALKGHKRGLMQKLFPTRGKAIPEFRFPEFVNDGAWEEKTLGDITKVVNRRNKSGRSLPVYSISNTDGFIPQDQQFKGLNSEARGYDTKAYKIVGKNTFAYNPARINVGSIGYSGDLKEVIISSLYVCFKSLENVDDSFLMCFFSSWRFNQAVESNVEGGIRSYLFYDNFAKIKIDLPSLAEQKKIADVFSSIDKAISSTTKYITLLENHKQGLMQQLFPSR